MAEHPTLSRQRGVALITVMVILLLSIIAVLAAGRTGLLNEALVGNDSDYGRALAAAEALLREGETEVRGKSPLGFLCRPTPGNPASPDNDPAFQGCRPNAPGTVFIPQDQPGYADLEALVSVTPATPCIQGICVPNNLNTLLGFEDAPSAALANMTTMAPLGARYGQYTRPVGAPPLDDALNPILKGASADPTAPSQGWYWIEVFRYANPPGGYSAGSYQALAPEGTSGFRPIFRITAIALGQKPGTRAVLRSFYVPNPTNPV